MAERALALVLAGLIGGFWGVTLLERDRPYVPTTVADSIPPAADPAAVPAAQAGGARIRLGFVGDLMQTEAQRHDDFRRSYAGVAPHLRVLDLAVGNLEFPVDSTLPVGPDPGTVRFNGSTAHLDAIADAGFDVLQTANNHCNDRGIPGLLRTLAAVRGRGMQPVGTATSRDSLDAVPVVVEIKGIPIGFRAYTMVPNVYRYTGMPEWPSRELPVDAFDFEYWNGEDRAYGQSVFQRHVAQARNAGAQFLVALVHWGREHHLAPSEGQRRAAHDLVDAGFDLVVGTHSHVLVPSELYRGRLIAYSLGNFLTRPLTFVSSVGAVLEVDVVAGASGASMAGFGFRPTYIRRPTRELIPVDSARSSVDAAAWMVARRVLGPGLRSRDAAAAP
ncbi:MAG TPA: CapA family protein [Gemmatimonadales bacterium]|nr:CapA family protein [Gemmatimonadales bacterium]